jgi:hypothetical protein
MLMRRKLGFVFVMLALVATSAASIAAQDMDVAFGDAQLRELGYPVVKIHVGPDGVEAPSTLEAGYYLIEFSSEGQYSGYMDIMIPPDGLTEDQATEQALMAARDDLVQPGWQYLGGANTFVEGEPVVFAIRLDPGQYTVAASYYLPEQGSEEIMTLSPLTVTGQATPVAATQASPVAAGAPQAGVTLEMTDDLRYIVTPDPVPAGPQIWQITNTGATQSHHVVMTKVPDGTTADDIVAEFQGMMAGTPPSGGGVVAQSTYVAYAALESGGATTWYELDLDPGTYAVICYIIDPATQMPHFMNGMITVFTVQ